jgi:signal transduction histidine kinase
MNDLDQRLLDATRVLGPLQSETSLVQVIADSAAITFEAAGTALFVVDADALVLATVSGTCVNVDRGLRVASGHAAIRRAVASGGAAAVTSADDAPDGLRNFCPALVVPMSPSKEMTGALWLHRPRPDDVAARLAVLIFAAQAAAALANARQHAAVVDSDARKDGEIATLAHELRNPLGAIINALQVLERFGAPDARAVRLRELIGRQAGHLTRLAEDVLDVARVRHGKLRLRRQPIDLRDVVRHAVESLQVSGRCAGHELRHAVAAAPVVVDGDETRLEQVVRNLADNALKYSPPHTAIDVSVEADGSDAVLRVRDHGLGISAELLPRLFEPYAQAEPGGGDAGGLGLGLPLVRAIVQEHGGTITAHSAGAGTGSEFVVRLPVSRESVPSTCPQRTI